VTARSPSKSDYTNQETLKWELIPPALMLSQTTSQLQPYMYYWAKWTFTGHGSNADFSCLPSPKAISKMIASVPNGIHERSVGRGQTLNTALPMDNVKLVMPMDSSIEDMDWRGSDSNLKHSLTGVSAVNKDVKHSNIRDH
jgi:hypothetical protein